MLNLTEELQESIMQLQRQVLLNSRVESEEKHAQEDLKKVIDSLNSIMIILQDMVRDVTLLCSLKTEENTDNSSKSSQEI